MSLSLIVVIQSNCPLRTKFVFFRNNSGVTAFVESEVIGEAELAGFSLKFSQKKFLLLKEPYYIA
jgi:hypothetical protein